jgi:hypothetical protein
MNVGSGHQLRSLCSRGRPREALTSTACLGPGVLLLGFSLSPKGLGRLRRELPTALTSWSVSAWNLEDARTSTCIWQTSVKTRVCVCVCVCERERERERDHPSAPHPAPASCSGPAAAPPSAPARSACRACPPQARGGASAAPRAASWGWRPRPAAECHASSARERKRAVRKMRRRRRKRRRRRRRYCGRWAPEHHRSDLLGRGLPGSGPVRF